jgi:hypothetical protein
MNYPAEEPSAPAQAHKCSMRTEHSLCRIRCLAFRVYVSLGVSHQSFTARGKPERLGGSRHIRSSGVPTGFRAGRKASQQPRNSNKKFMFVG